MGPVAALGGEEGDSPQYLFLSPPIPNLTAPLEYLAL